jgi:hypothetical protein
LPESDGRLGRSLIRNVIGCKVANVSLTRKAPGLARFQRTRPRKLASASTLPASTSSPSDSDYTPCPSSSSNSQEVFIDLRHSLQKGPRKWVVSRIPNSSSRSPSPYQSLGYAEFDPFNGIRLSRDDQNLLHHCEFIT